MEDKRITRRNLIAFPLGTIGRDMIYNLVTSYLLTFVLFTRHLTAAQLSAITGIMVAARIFDALNDPIMGNIIERTRTKWGKFKPWLAIGIVTTSVVIYLTFNVRLEGWAFVWFFGLMYFLYSACSGLSLYRIYDSSSVTPSHSLCIASSSSSILFSSSSLVISIKFKR